MSTPATITQGQPNIVVSVGKQVRSFIEKKTLHLPADYSAENALKQAWLKLQEVVDKDKRPALSVCTHESINNALLDMVVQGLNPAKNQCYLIVYGQKLLCQRSYFGDIALAQRVMPGAEVIYSVIYKGDTFQFEVVRGRKVITKHAVNGLEGMDDANILGAYCSVVDANGEDLGAEIMTIDQIKKSWSMSKTYRADGNTPHNTFPSQMCLRTVIRRRLKTIINSSSDRMLMEAVERQDDEAIEAEVTAEISEKANGEVLALSAPEEPSPKEESAPNVATPQVDAPVEKPVAAQEPAPVVTTPQRSDVPQTVAAPVQSEPTPEPATQQEEELDF